MIQQYNQVSTAHHVSNVKESNKQIIDDAVKFFNKIASEQEETITRVEKDIASGNTDNIMDYIRDAQRYNDEATNYALNKVPPELQNNQKIVNSFRQIVDNQRVLVNDIQRLMNGDMGGDTMPTSGGIQEMSQQMDSMTQSLIQPRNAVGNTPNSHSVRLAMTRKTI